MRKTLEFVSLAGLGALAWVTAEALAGSHRLPSRIPTHFDMAGRPNGWGTPHMLLLLPIVGGAMYLLMTVVSRYPGAFNYPVRVTPANSKRLQELALGMIAWLKAEVIWLFAAIQIAAVHAARSGGGGLPAWMMPLVLGVVFGTIIGYVIAMRRSA